MQALLNVVLLQHRVVELHFGVLLDELFVNLRVAHACASGNQRLQFRNQDVFANASSNFAGVRLARDSMSSYSCCPIKFPPGKNVAA